MLDAKGIISHIQQVRLEGNTMYRSQSGNYPTRSKDEKRLLLIESVGIKGFIKR